MIASTNYLNSLSYSRANAVALTDVAYAKIGAL